MGETISLTGLFMLALQVLLGLVAFFGALVVRGLIGEVKDLRLTDKELLRKFDNYVQRDDLQDIKRHISGIFERLDDIKDAVSNKASREELYAAMRSHTNGDTNGR